MSGTGPGRPPRGVRRAVPALVAVALSVAVVAGILRSGWLEGDPPVPANPPPAAVDTAGAYLVVEPAVVRRGGDTRVRLTVVNPDPEPFPNGLGGRLQRWDGTAWVDEQQFLTEEGGADEQTRVYDLDEPMITPAVLLGAPARGRGATQWLDVGRLAPGWYRLGQGADAVQPLGPDGEPRPAPPGDVRYGAFGLLEVRAGS